MKPSITIVIGFALQSCPIGWRCQRMGRFALTTANCVDGNNHFLKRKKMDASNNIVVALFMAIIIVPILLIVRSINKKKKIMAAKAEQLSAQYQLTLTESDKWDNIVLGLDAKAGKLLWLRAGLEQDEHLLVDLNTIAHCKAVKDARTVTYNKQTSHAVDWLSLEFLSKNGNEKPIAIEFFNAKNSFVFNDHLQLLDKWQKTILKQLSGVSA